MTRHVVISFNSIMYENDEKIEISSKGIYSVKDGKHYVVYNEKNDDGQSVRNILKFDSESLEVSKIGITRTNMYYKAGHEHNDTYSTPFGTYDMCIKTEEYALFEQNEAFDIIVLYDLELGGCYVSKCKVQIKIV